MNSHLSVTLALASLFALSGCAHNPPCPPEPRYELPNPDLMVPPPEQGEMRRKLNGILDQGQT